MASLAKPTAESRRAGIPVPTAEDGTAAPPGARLTLLHAHLADGALDVAIPVLDAARVRARAVFVAAGSSDAADRLAVTSYAADVVVGLAIEGDLDATDVEITADALGAARGEPRATVSLDLLERVARHPVLLEIPPRVGGEIQLRLVRQLGFVSAASLWLRRATGSPLQVLAVGPDQASRRVRATAKSALRRAPSLSLLGRASLRTMRVGRFGETEGVVVARVSANADTVRADEALRIVAAALSPVLERETMLTRSADRERALVAAGEKRLVRLGFDLHDGPVQDVLVLAEEIRVLRDQLYPFVLESHRDAAYRRFDDLVARVGAIDGQLREVAHSLESKSIVSRPIGEVLHREVEAFADRSGIDAHLEIKGDPESLTAAQRIAVFRAIQESLSNVREHSGATAVEIRVHSRRNATSVRITDNGEGFDVPRALARAAKRGRLGVVGIGERVRMLGGAFSLDSEPGGPTTLSFTLPHWQVLEQSEHV
jgi:signal transduction histidine kinase